MDAAFLFNPTLRALRRQRAQRFAGQGSDGFLFAEGAEALADRLGFIRRNFSTPVLHGLDFGALPAAIPHYASGQQIGGEQEVWPLEPQSCDLIVSNLQLHWVNDLPGLLIQMRASLRPDGFFSGCLVGGESLFELRAALAETETRLGLPSRPRVSPMIDLPTATGLMQRAGFALPVVDHEILNLSYQSPLTLLKDLRVMGQTHSVTGQRRTIDSKAFWPTLISVYEELFPHPEGGVRATFDLLFLSGWAPAASQQKPLAPGSAAHDLAEALKG